MSRAIAFLSVGILFSASAIAADNGIYIGAAVSRASADVDLSSGSTVVPIDDDNTRFKVIAGIRPLDWLAFEVNYFDFGTIDAASGAATGEYKLKGIDVFGMLMLEVGLVDFYGKVGVVRWDQEASITNINVASFEDDGTDPAYGAGIQVHFGSIGARLEYEMLDIEDADSSMISLGVTWTFL